MLELVQRYANFVPSKLKESRWTEQGAMIVALVIPVLTLTRAILELLVPIAATKLQDEQALKRLMSPRSLPVETLPPLKALDSI